MLTVLLALPGLLAQGDPELMLLQRWLTGSFSSEAQAAEDPDFKNIRLEMVAIWPERADGPWIYVEQTLALSIDKPYRQRVYRLSRLGPNHFQSTVYTLAEPEALIGAWRDPQRFKALAPEQLEERAGCAVFLEKGEAAFVGGTRGDDCLSTLRGAHHARSEIELFADRLISWDRGFSEDGRQVWGAEKGGYRFVRQVSADQP